MAESPKTITALFVNWLYPNKNNFLRKTFLYYEIMPFVATQMHLDIITLSEVSQMEKDKYYMTSLLCRILNNDTNEFIYKTKTDS